ncbi:hypothetical protein O0I10_011493 [Lichtheimia ornata]|uniref:F-box domain-containing protein n=1 Tax=Lichtheimia ornata TaxID=688661 RepID=A0AAD7USV3_9FUNG|nr:uncharacterized protein O0I10_011493 [Lichtheimia ornata]KAJ8652893.1 hypothetical protein O0I10_011493 [Lichtheimia ornata]
MAAIEHISWSELLKHANITAQHGNDGNRIATATESLQQIAHQFAEELNERAKLLANSAQFDRALHDAAAIRAMLPGSGLGYLCTGDVYCQQGRHAAAISIYDQGLEAVSASDPYYHHLQQHRMQVAPNNNKRVDFISRLPLDIVITNIVPRMTPTYLDSNELYGPLYVSRTWQERILQQSKGLTFEFGQEDHTFKTGHDQLIRFAPYVQKLRGNVFDDAELKDLFSRARFSNLKDLRIYCDSTTPHLPVLHGLQLISDSLTHLNIDGYHYFDLSDILESCPNLVSLETEHVEPVLSSPPSSRYPKITHLALHDVSEDEAPSHDDVIDLLSRFPSLLSFELTPMSDSSILMTIHEHCPYLQVLYYGAKNYPSKKIDIHPNQKGIKSAHLGGEYTEDLFMQGDLVEFLYMHRNLLESVGFSGEFEADDSLWKLVDGNSGV